MTAYLMPKKVSRQDNDGESGYIMTLTYTQEADGRCAMRCDGGGMATLLVCDRDGHYMEQTDYGVDRHVWRRSVIEYDGDGRQTSGVTYDGDGRVTGRSVFSYGADGKLAEHAIYGSDGRMVFRCICEQGGARITNLSYGRDGSLRGESREEYDTDGRLLKRVNGNAGHFEEFFYDADGNRTESVFHAPDGRAKTRTLYTHDQSGNPTEDATYNADGTLLHRNHYTYVALSEGKSLLTEHTSYFGESVEYCIKLLETCDILLTAGQAKVFRSYYEEVIMD